jgi:hypothetical protein
VLASQLKKLNVHLPLESDPSNGQHTQSA